MEAGPQSAAILYHRKRSTLICLDVQNYIDKPGPSLAGLVALDWPCEPDENCPAADALRCCMLRCEIITEVVKKLMTWHKQQELGRLGLTTASVAMAAFRHRGMMDEIDLPDDQQDRDLQRAAYHGGRTEALWIGERMPGIYRPHPLSQYRPPLFHDAPIGPYYLIDSSSFYGSIYEQHDLPQKILHRGELMTKSEATKLITDDTWLAEVRIHSNRERFPVKTDDGQLYAVGHFTTTLCGPELHRAVQTGCVHSVGNWQHMECSPILRRYSQMIYAERIKAQESGELVISSWCKQLIAQLHGKFAQRINRWVVCPDVECGEPWEKWSTFSNETHKLTNYRAIGTEVQREQSEGDAPICFPAIPAWVAACGREQLRLWELLAGKRNVLYVSTDSLITNKIGYENLLAHGEISDNKMGALRVLTKSDHVQIRGMGTYSLGDVIVTQGIKHNASEKIFGTIDEMKWSGLEYAINNRGTPIIRAINRKVTPAWHYDPARVDDDGWVATAHLTTGFEQWDQYRKKSQINE